MCMVWYITKKQEEESVNVQKSEKCAVLSGSDHQFVVVEQQQFIFNLILKF